VSQPSIQQAAAALAEEFAFFSDWEERYAHVIDLGKAVPPLSEADKTEANRVRGCASQVWLTVQPASGGRIRLAADSDAHIVRGLIALTLAVYQDRTPDEILAFSADDLFARLGLAEALSSQRANGLRSLIGRIRDEAAKARGTPPPIG
jgi:cysteine desulfuration protein SufE